MEFAKKIKLSIIFLFVFTILSSQFLGVINAARFEFSPATNTFERGCVRSIDVMIDMQGGISNAAEIEITYNPSLITVIDSAPSIPGIQVESGDAFDTYFYNVVDQPNGHIRVAGASFFSTLSTTRRFVTIHFQSSPSATTAGFNIRFDGVGVTIDSNIADAVTNNDLLTGVTNGNYTFVSGACVADTVPPQINFISPTNGQSNFPLSNNLQVRLTDNASGIDLSTVEFILNGDAYTPSSSQVTYTGIATNYLFTINPSSDLPANQAISFRVRASDHSGNSANRQITFNVPTPVTPQPAPPTPTDNIPPTVTFVTPEGTVVNIGEDQELEFVIEEVNEGAVISGINPDSIRVTLNGQTYNASNISMDGNDMRYSISISHNNSLLEDDINFLRVQAADRQGNRVDTTTAFILNKELFCKSVEDKEPEDKDEDIDTNENPTVIIKEVCNNNISDIFTSENLLKNTPLENTIIANYVNQNGFAGAISLLGAIFLLLNLIPLLGLLFGTPGLFFKLISFFIGKDEKVPWGVITDYVTEKPVPFAVCQLYVSGSQYKIGQTVSDLEGRYGFVITEGKYRLEVQQSGYKKFIKEIVVAEGEESYVYDIRLIPNNSEVTQEENKVSIFRKIKDYLVKLYNVLFPIFLSLGIVFAILSVLITPTTINWIILVLYIIYVLYLILPNVTKQQKYAAVIDSSTGLRIPFAQIKIYSLDDMKLIDSQVTNYNGLFDYYREEGEFGVMVAARGYNFPSKQNTYPVVEGTYKGMIKLPLKKGKNKVAIYVDPDEKNIQSGELGYGDKVTSPFG